MLCDAAIKMGSLRLANMIKPKASPHTKDAVGAVDGGAAATGEEAAPAAAAEPAAAGSALDKIASAAAG
jgi:hypothetical protein